jgi:hypothetical protein
VLACRVADGWCAASDAAAEDGDGDALAAVCAGCAGRDADEELHPANRTAAMAASSGQGFAIGVPHRLRPGKAEVLADLCYDALRCAWGYMRGMPWSGVFPEVLASYLAKYRRSLDCQTGGGIFT